MSDPAARPPVAWDAPAEVAAGPAPGIRFAPHGPRLLAYLIDVVVLVAMIVAWVLVMSVVGPLTSGAGRLLFAVGAVVVILAAMTGYFAWFWSHGGQTLGMKPFRLYVVRDLDGGPVSPGKAWLRVFGLYVIDGAVFYLGFIWVFIDSRRRAWHDIMAGTIVIQPLAAAYRPDTDAGR